MKKADGTFCYTYSAKEQEEIRRIRREYGEFLGEEDGLGLLRSLDAEVHAKANAAALSAAFLGILDMGLGMSLVLSGLPEMLGLDSGSGFVLGVIIGTAGMLAIGCAYPIYSHVLKRERKRIAPEILRLSEKLMKQPLA